MTAVGVRVAGALVALLLRVRLIRLLLLAGVVLVALAALEPALPAWTSTAASVGLVGFLVWRLVRWGRARQGFAVAPPETERWPNGQYRDGPDVLG